MHYTYRPRPASECVLILYIKVCYAIALLLGNVVQFYTDSHLEEHALHLHAKASR
jgi:hypothetical protein